MFEIADLGTPELFLILKVGFVCEVSYPEDSFVRNRAQLYREFEELILAVMIPAITYKFIFYVFQYLSSVCSTVPGKKEVIFLQIDLICKPFLQSYRGRQKFVQYCWGASNRKFHRVH